MGFFPSKPLLCVCINDSNVQLNLQYTLLLIWVLDLLCVTRLKHLSRRLRAISQKYFFLIWLTRMGNFPCPIFNNSGPSLNAT